MSALQHILAGDPGETAAPPLPPPPPPQTTQLQPQAPAITSPKPSPSVASSLPSAPPMQSALAPPASPVRTLAAPATPVGSTRSPAHSPKLAPLVPEPEAERAVGTPQSRTENAVDDVIHASGTASSRKAALNVSSVYTGNKIKHLKKEDGIPLWRKDIQYDFLSYVFNDKTKCFTKYSDKTTGYTFAEVYVDAMANSSKCSKTLATKLLDDLPSAMSMAMVCLLVNIGRMNTTLNFFPEMRAQLRTYHSIPALQAHQDAVAYKQLQDAPRLKSILKGASEDTMQPGTIEDLRTAPRPRTNPVNLIFVMSQYAPKVTELHFEPPRDFHDLIMRTTLSSHSRARAFLWLIWWYMESDFTREGSQRNPFGPGQFGEGDDAKSAVPERVPSLESLTEEQAQLENVDSPEETYFGEMKRKERIAVLATDPSPAMTALKRARKEKGLMGVSGAFASDDERSEAGWLASRVPGGNASRFHETGSEYTRSPSPAGSRLAFSSTTGASKQAGDVRILDLLNDNATAEGGTINASVKKGPGRGNWRRNKTSKPDASGHVPLLPNHGQLNFVNDGPSTPSSFAANVAQGSPPNQSSQKGGHVPTPSYQNQKRVRGITQHQSAVINHRKRQIDYTLDRRIRRVHARAQEEREVHGPILRAWKRLRQMPADYDSDEEAGKAGRGKNGNEKEDEGRGGKNKENVDVADDYDPYRRSRLLLGGFARIPTEPENVGEEARTLAKTFQRLIRRSERWAESQTPGLAMTRRRELEARGLKLLPSKKRVLIDDDGPDMPDEPNGGPVSVKIAKKGGRASTVKSNKGRANEEDNGDLDDEDREIVDILGAARGIYGDEDDEMDED